MRVVKAAGVQLSPVLYSNPLIMKEMAKLVPDAASYAPVTILVEEWRNSVMSINENVQPLYVESDEPDLVGYYPKWLDNLADDATLEGSLLDGIVTGKEGVRAIVVAIRALYDRQEHKFADTYRDNRFMEEYIAVVRGEPIGCVVLVTNNAEGKAQHIVASYRPRSALMRMSRLLREKFAGTTYAQYFAASERREGSSDMSSEARAH